MLSYYREYQVENVISETKSETEMGEDMPMVDPVEQESTMIIQALESKTEEQPSPVIVDLPPLAVDKGKHRKELFMYVFSLPTCLPTNLPTYLPTHL